MLGKTPSAMQKPISSLFLCALMLLLLGGCRNTKDLAFGIVEPAPVKLPHAMKRIGVVKSIHLSDKKQQPVQKIDDLISRDDDFLAKKGMEAALDGLLKQLLQDPRFDTIIKLSEGGELIQTEEGKVTQSSWQAIRMFCERYGLDAVFSLDFYNANTEVTLKRTKIYQRDLMREAVAEKGHQLTLETLIENGWRIYDPFQEEVLDEFTYKEQLTTNAVALSPLGAYRNIGSRHDSLMLKSRNSGSAYGSRLQPYETTIYRSYFTKGTEGFIAAQHKVEEKDWEGAITIWKKELDGDKNKLKAMACHNLAVVHEVMENLEEALVWAVKASEYHNSKETMDYITELERRISQRQLVQEELLLSGR